MFKTETQTESLVKEICVLSSRAAGVTVTSFVPTDDFLLCFFFKEKNLCPKAAGRYLVLSDSLSVVMNYKLAETFPFVLVPTT